MYIDWNRRKNEYIGPKKKCPRMAKSSQSIVVSMLFIIFYPHQNSLLYTKKNMIAQHKSAFTMFKFFFFIIIHKPFIFEVSIFKNVTCPCPLCIYFAIVMYECHWILSSKDGLYWNRIHFECLDLMMYCTLYHLKIFYRIITV